MACSRGAGLWQVSVLRLRSHLLYAVSMTVDSAGPCGVGRALYHERLPGFDRPCPARGVVRVVLVDVDQEVFLCAGHERCLDYIGVLY